MIRSSSPWPTSSTATTSRSRSSVSSSTGASSTSRGTGYETFDDLVGYCRLVAGSVGRLSLADLRDPLPGVGRAAGRRARRRPAAHQHPARRRRGPRDGPGLPAPRGGAPSSGAHPTCPGPPEAVAALVAASRSARAEEYFAAGPRAARRCSTAAAGRASRRWPGIYRRLLDRGSRPTRRGCCGSGSRCRPARRRGSRPGACRSVVPERRRRRRVVVVGGGLAGHQPPRSTPPTPGPPSRSSSGAAGSAVARGRSERHGLVIDNGQHVFLRCCTEYRAFVERIGGADIDRLQDGSTCRCWRRAGRRSHVGARRPARAAAPRTVARRLSAPRAAGRTVSAIRGARCASGGSTRRRRRPTQIASATGWPPTARASGDRGASGT